MLENFDPETNGESKDIVADNIAQLKQLFPEVFTEDKVDFNALQEALGEYIDTSDERFNFTWHGKAAAKRIAQTPSCGTLRPCIEESKNWETTQNLFIDGDNLEVLKLLQKAYHKRVKMIYIDPPYNTDGDFIYPDSYSENIDTYLRYTNQLDEEGRKYSKVSEEDGRYHTRWLNMIYPRLILARNLLSDEGIIFISIDDHEKDNLAKICDEIFGQENSLVPFIWPLPRGINAGHISRSHEYVLVYAKNKNNLPLFNKLGDTDFSIDRCNKKIDRRHPATPINFPAGIRYEGPNQTFTGELSGSEKVFIDGELIFEDGKLKQAVTLTAGWTMKDMIERWLSGETVYDSKGQKIVEFFFKENGKLYSKKIQEFQSAKSVLQNAPDTQRARDEIESIFGSQDVFPYPKPSDLIKRFVDIATKDDDIILDFFAGSAPTSQAVMMSNLEGKTARKFILVQLPELIDEDDSDLEAAIEFCKSIGKPTTIAEIGKERIRRVGEKIKSDNTYSKSLDDLDIGFRVFKLDSSNIKPWDADFEQLEADLYKNIDNIKAERSSDDVLYELLLKYGIELTIPIESHAIEGKTVYSVGLGALLICLDDDITLDVIDGIGKLKEELQPETVHVVLKDAGLKDDVVKTNAIQLLKRYDINDVKTL